MYQLNAVLAGYLTPADCAAAIKDMQLEERLNAPDFSGRYHYAAKMYQDELAKKRRARDDRLVRAWRTARRRTISTLSPTALAEIFQAEGALPSQWLPLLQTDQLRQPTP
ncbi:hypothetical protein [Streptomyces mirabilis]|uniref:hypothetical protein n=1 Tax=Streptomyces mirabilis TaxID=68239 RepID=UPI0036813E50